MAIIAIDTATETLALAIGDERGRLLARWNTLAPKLHATLLHPLLDQMCEAVGLSLADDVSGIVAGVGPGSYTGVRIGVTAAKTLAYALRVPVVGVSSLKAAAYAARAHRGLIGVLWDARRGEAYLGLYDSADWRLVEAERRMPYEEAAQCMLQAGAAQQQILLLGDGARKGAEALHTLSSAGSVELAQSESAVTFGSVAIYNETANVCGGDLFLVGVADVLRCLENGKEGDHGEKAHDLVPRYLQLAEAEARLLHAPQGTLSDGS